MPKKKTSDNETIALFNNGSDQEQDNKTAKSEKTKKKPASIIKAKKPQENYLQISGNNLIFFLSAGCFIPKIICKEFKYNFNSSDFFSAFENRLIITSKFCNNFKDDLMVELNLDNTEHDNVEIKKDLTMVALKGFIPVSRIKNIFFISEEARTNFLNSLNENAPNYSEICRVDKKMFDNSLSLEDLDIKTIIEKTQKEGIDEEKIKISRYISILGMLKLISISDYLSWQYKKSFTYPSNEFLSLLHYINKSAFDITQVKYKSEHENTFKILLNQKDKRINNLIDYVLNYIIEKIDMNKKFSADTISEITSEIEEYLKKSKNSSTDKKISESILNDLKNWVNEVPGCTYDKLTEKEIFLKNWSFLLLLLLIKYSNKEKIKEIFSPLKTLTRVGNNSEIFWQILAGLGRYFGYRNLLNNLFLEQDDKFIGQLIGNNITLKYSELIHFERILMESVFKFILNNDTYSDNFKFITSTITGASKEPKNEIVKSENYIITFKNYEILGLPIKNFEIEDRISRLLNTIKKHYPTEIKEREYYLAFVLLKYNLISFNLNKNYSFIKLEMLLDYINNNKEKFMPFANYLEDAIRFDKAHGNIR